MTDTPISAEGSTAAALRTCESEPIHIPGHIQPHGILIAVEISTGTIRYASANARSLLTQEPQKCIGERFQETAVVQALQALDFDQASKADKTQSLQSISIAGMRYNSIAHSVGDLRVLEFESAPAGQSDTLDSLYPHLRSFIDSLPAFSTTSELSNHVACQVREITGFDRVLVYQFDEDWNGTVVAEDRNDTLPSYLDLRFPASDIPAQARALYKSNRQRLIVDADYVPVRILGKDGDRPLDLSHSVLRSVSPVHLEYMRNMGTTSSMSISVLVDGQLWGLISCHSAEPRRVPFHVRTACDFLAQMYSLQLMTRERSAEASERLDRQAIQSELLAFMAAETKYMQGMLNHPGHLLRFVDADGVAVVFEEKVSLIGTTPTEAEVWKIAEWLEKSQSHDEVFATSSLQREIGDAPIGSAVAGLLSISISQLHPSFVMWFRKEVVQTVKWGGQPQKTKMAGQLHPRQSFDIWKETVRGTSLPWSRVQQTVAGSFRNAIIGIVMRKAEELAVLTNDLRQSNKELEAFSYSVSHDLRAPFRHIVGYAELLKEEDTVSSHPRSLRFIDTIIESAFSAGKLVDDLLSFSQMSRATVSSVKVNMDRLVADVLRVLAPDARIEWQIEQLAPAWGDPNMLRQVLQNLIENAIKYSRKSAPPKIRIWSEIVGQEIIYSVRDNGVGFDMAYVDKLFGVFQRLHRMEDYEGTGIGLANVRRIVERHRGRAWAEGQLDQGATFHFALPRTAKE